MNRNCLKTLCLIAFLWCISSLAIWLGVYFGVWQSYFSIHWHDSHCIVQHLEHFQWYVSTKGGPVAVRYTSMQVLVNISSEWVSGFACGSPGSKSTTLGSMSAARAYPYEAGSCPDADKCGKQVFLPIWFCKDCFGCDEFLTGQPLPCKWSIGGDRKDEKEPEAWAQSLNMPFPMRTSEYVQTVLGSEVYYNQEELLVLHIFCGIGVFLPLCFFLSICGAFVYQRCGK